MNQSSGASRTAVSDAAGHFRLGGLPAGVYTLHLDLDGFAPVHVGAFPVSVGQTVTHRIEMKPAHVIEKIEVKGQPGCARMPPPLLPPQHWEATASRRRRRPTGIS